MPVCCALIDAGLLVAGEGDQRESRIPVLSTDVAVGVVHLNGSVASPGSMSEAWAGGRLGRIAFELPLEAMGLANDDPTVLVVAAAAGRCFPRDLVLVAPPTSPLIAAAEAAGTRIITIEGPDALVDLDRRLADLDAAEQRQRAEVGVGPHPAPWPTGSEFDSALLEHGDQRNVVDRYRYWSEAAIVADLDLHRQSLHVAVENWQHDLNIGTVVRNANAFNVAGVHIIGKRRWNRRGAMATDRYLHLRHHASIEEFARWADAEGLAIIGIDNVDSSMPMSGEKLPKKAVLLFGQEGPGLSSAALASCESVLEIPQQGSTRSLNAGVASGIAMYVWTSQHPQSGDGD